MRIQSRVHAPLPVTDSGLLAGSAHHSSQQEQTHPRSSWGWSHFLPFLGPAFMSAVAYIDPGNFASNLQAGAEFGYQLLWVVLGANLMAMLIQTLSARLGLATGRNLAECIAASLPTRWRWMYWIQAEIVAIATDVAEFVGAALAFKMLFGWPLWFGAIMTGVITWLMLSLRQYGLRWLEVVIAMTIVVILGGFLVQLAWIQPHWQPLMAGFIPAHPSQGSVPMIAAIVGATVMPHVIYLHSSLTQKRGHLSPSQRSQVMRFYRLDVFLGMAIAGAINLLLLIMAAALLFPGHSGSVSLETMDTLLAPLLGNETAGIIFALALLAAGITSSVIGTLSGQVIMQSFIHRQIPISWRRGLTMIPALIVVLAGVPVQTILVDSQIVLSFGIPFALIPLVWLTAQRRWMGDLVSSRTVTWLATVFATAIVLLNLYLLLS